MEVAWKGAGVLIYTNARSGVNKGGYWGYLPTPPRIFGTQASRFSNLIYTHHVHDYH